MCKHSRVKLFRHLHGQGIESEHVSYNAGYTNVHELIPWRTLSGRQQLYQDHPWMRAFGEELCVYKPPIDLKTTKPALGAIQ
jgi:nitrate reductase alpha subunit